MLRPTTTHTSRTTGGFVGFIFKACSDYHGVYAPEVTVESYDLYIYIYDLYIYSTVYLIASIESKKQRSI